MATTPSTVLALDVGAKRIGVASASLIARLPQPLTTLDAESDDLLKTISQLVETEGAAAVIIGLPRGLEGQQTAQTATVEAFAAEIREQLEVPVHMQDEAVTSRKAEAELESRGKPYSKGDIDALAATYILEDWLLEHTEQTA